MLPIVKPVNVPPLLLSVHKIDVMEPPQLLEKTCQYTSVSPETQVAERSIVVAVATNENHTSSSGVPELLVHAPDGVTPDADAPAVV